MQPIDRPRFGYETQRGELRNLSGGGNLAKSVYWGWKHTRCRQTRIDGRRKALFRLDDIEDRAVNVDPPANDPWQAAALLQLGDDRQVPGDPIFTRLFPCHHRPHCRVVIDRAWREAPARPPPHRAGHARKHRAGGSGPEMFLRGATKRKAAWKAA
jgi:hypothetical protein